MPNENFAEILNNAKQLTIGQIFKLFLKLKYSTVLTLIAVFMGITGSAYMAGQSNAKQDAAVMLRSPFAMRIVINDETYDFNRLTLIEDPASALPDDKVKLSLRAIHSPFDTLQVGQIIATVDRGTTSKFWQYLFSYNIINTVRAEEPVFNWNGHAQDFRYKEGFVNSNTIHRYYADGCILEYKIDRNKRSIPSSFRWVNRSH